MQSALIVLTRLQARAAVRRTFRGLRKPKNAVFFTVGLLVFSFWLAPVLFSAAVVRKTDPATTRLVAPLVLMLLCVMTLFGGGGDRVISFSPGEVNFLFPGPFTRRQLLLYKLARTLAGGLASGFILSIVLLQHAPTWPAAFAGGVLSMVLVQLLTLAAVMAAQAVGARAYSLGRRVAVGVLVAGAAVAVAPLALDVAAGGGVLEQARRLNESAPARVLFAPLEPFARTFTAQSAAALGGWGALAAAIDLALLGLILRLDTDYREVALAASERASARRQRLRRGQVVQQFAGTRGGGDSTAGAKRRFRGPLPMFPWFGGAGPTAWRQVTAAVRGSRGVLMVLLLLSLAAIPLMLIGKRNVVPVLFGVGWLTIFLTMVLKFDFRAELDQIEWLKALPLRPTATAAGQLAVPVVLLSAIQFLYLGGAAAIVGPEHRWTLIAALPFLPAFNVLVIGLENLLFLLFPSRTGAAPGDLGYMGRQVVFTIVKLLAMAVACALAAAMGYAAFAVRGSVTAGVVMALVALATIAAAVVPCVGWAYRRFDPSSDTPA